MIEQPTNDMERWLLDTVTRQAADAGVPTPEVDEALDYVRSLGVMFG